MSLQLASIIFNDSESRFNKDLTDFLSRNVEAAITKGGLSFDFKIARPNDLAELRNMGVKRLPAMLIEGKSFVSVPDIIDEIRRRVKTNLRTALPKTEDEIVRDYQIQALGKVKKDAEGKFVVSDDPANDEGADLMSSFNNEIARRGASAGHDNQGHNNQGHNKSAPARGRDVEQDYDEPPAQHARQTRTAPGQQQQTPMYRADNIDNPSMGDAYASLKAIGKNATKDDAQDDVMMATLLARMGND